MLKDKGKWFNQRLLAISLVLIPIAFLAWLLGTRAVNTPFWDQWELVPIIEHIRSGHFIFGDFWHQHNEHRLVFPQLAMIASAILTHWNTIVELFMGFVVAIISYFVLLKIFFESESKTLSRSAIFIPLLISLIWFSPVQIENWLWGWQIQWFMNVCGVVLVSYAISRAAKAKAALTIPDLLLLILGGLFGQFSLANGTLIWPIAVLALLILKVDIKKVAIVFATGLVATILYFYHFVSPANPPSHPLHQPISYIRYVLIYLGRPLSFIHKLTFILGFLILMVFVLSSLYLLIKKRDIFIKVIPWVFLGTYAIGSALITGYGRLGFGVDEAYASRYTTVSTLLLVGTIMIIWYSRSLISIWLKKWYRYLMPIGALILVGLVGINIAWGVHNSDEHSFYLREIKQCTHLSTPSNICLASTYPDPQKVLPRLDYLKEIHWGGY